MIAAIYVKVVSRWRVFFGVESVLLRKSSHFVEGKENSWRRRRGKMRIGKRFTWKCKENHRVVKLCVLVVMRGGKNHTKVSDRLDCGKPLSEHKKTAVKMRKSRKFWLFSPPVNALTTFQVCKKEMMRRWRQSCPLPPTIIISIILYPIVILSFVMFYAALCYATINPQRWLRFWYVQYVINFAAQLSMSHFGPSSLPFIFVTRNNHDRWTS